MKKLLPFLLFIFSFVGFNAKASHIVGGEMIISYVGGNNYQIQIKVYRDCLPGNSNFEDPINVRVYNSSNALLQTISIAAPVITSISTAANNACLSSPPNLCLEEAIYTTTANFPPLAGGYILAYQRCCRNASCLNLNNPGGQGATFTQTIPDPGLATTNNSPFFNTLPPIVICANSQLTYNDAATDPDGDSLAYSLYRPYGSPMGGGGSPPPFSVVNYSGTFVYTNPITGAPPLAINSSTGVLTLFPTQIGQFVIGVCVREYRNHVLIGTHYRDFQFNVVQCIQNIVSAFTPTSGVSGLNGCVNTPIHFNNTSTGTANFTWHFGDGASSSGTSPNHTYNTPGIYTVTLIAEPGQPCADSATTTIHIYAVPVTTATSNTPLCAGSTLNLMTPALVGGSYSWTGPNVFSSVLQNPTIANAQVVNGGIYFLTATVNGCPSIPVPDTVVIYPIPAAPVLGSNSPLCVGQSINLTATTPLTGVSYHWSGPNGWNTLAHNPNIGNAQAINAGVYSCYIIVNGCQSATATINVIVNPIPATPIIGSNSPLCVGQILQLNATLSVGTYHWSGPTGFTSTLQNPTRLNVQLVDSGIYSLFFVAPTGCSSSTSTLHVTVFTVPVVTASSNSPVCTNSPINLSSTTLVGGTYSWVGPNSFSSALQNPTITPALIIDSGNYTVLLSLNGCVSLPSTTHVTIIPMPAAPILSSNSPVCSGQSINLFAQNVAGGTFSWTKGAWISALQNPVRNNANVAMSGNYSATVTVNGCASIPTIINVIVNQTPAPTITVVSPICSGQTIAFSTGAIAGATYSWIGPGGWLSSLQNPSILNATTANSGVYSLIVTVNGCSNVAVTTNVVVNQTPTLPVITTNSPVCTGQTMTFSIPAFASGTYSWTGPGAWTSTLQNPTRTNAQLVMAGSYSVMVSALGCSSPTVSTIVNVNQTPTPTITVGSPVCSGQTLSFSTAALAGATFSWTGPGGWTSALQNPTILNASVANSGVYSLVVTVNGCSNVAVTSNVVVNQTPSPTITVASPICSGQTISFLTAAVAGATYSWTGPGGWTSALQNPTIVNSVVANTGSYSIVVSANGCSNAAANANVVVNQSPTPTFTTNSPICSGQTINFSTTALAGATYAWSGPLGWTSTLQNPSITNAPTTATGTYSLIVTQNGCSNVAVTAVVNVNQMPSVPVITSNTPLCSGNTMTFSIPATAGATYSWTGPAGWTSVAQNPTRPNAQTAMSGTYSVNVTALGCGSASGNVVVTVNQTPSPTITVASPVCSGQTISFSTAALAGATFAWSGPNAWTSTAQNPTIPNSVVANTGTYSLVVTSNACSNVAVTATVTVNQTPAAPTIGSNSPVCTGTSINLTSNLFAGATYNWTGPNAWTSTLQNPTIANALLTYSGVYHLNITDNGCTGATSNTTVVVSQTPTLPVVGSNSPLCEGSSINLTASSSAGSTYAWSGPLTYSSSTQNPSIPNALSTMSGVYSVTASLGTCNSPVATVNVVVNTVPTSPFTITSPVCAMQNATVTYSGTGTAAATYNWNFNGGNIITGNAAGPYTVQWTTGGNFSVILSVTENGCTSPADTQNIQVYAVPTSLFSVQSPLCLYDSSLITFTGTTQGAATYNWTFDANTNILSGTNGGPYYLSFTNAGSHFISLATTENGCISDTTTQTVMVTGTPLASFILTPSIICPGKTTIDSATVGTNSVNAVYAWTYTGGSFVSGGANVLHLMFTNPGVYPVTLTVSDSGCVSPMVTHNLTVDSLPTAGFTTIDTLGCDPYTVHFTDNSYHADAYSWSFGDGGNSNTSNPVHVYNTGVYSVWQTVISSAGCRDSVYEPNLITVLVPPVAAFSVSPNPDLYYELPNAVFQFTNHSQFATNYVWNFGDVNGDTSMQLSPIHTFADSGYYMVQLVAFNAIGCTDTAQAGPLMVIPKNNNFIPNAFTPNNDGVNDIFYVYGQSLKSASLAIYDRWGELVFESADGLHNGWDGTFHGKPMNTGVYVYSTIIYTLTNKRYVIKGDVTLIR